MMQRVLENRDLPTAVRFVLITAEKSPLKSYFKKGGCLWNDLQIGRNCRQKTGSIGKKAVLWKRNDDGAQ